MMDKYTVDLDKVLNDFEYSELTDQSSVSGTLQHLNHNQRQELYKPVKKHSINNVFQSLNEYLNTDISGKHKDSATGSITSLTAPEQERPELKDLNGKHIESITESIANVSAKQQESLELNNEELPQNSATSSLENNVTALKAHEGYTNLIDQPNIEVNDTIAEEEIIETQPVEELLIENKEEEVPIILNDDENVGCVECVEVNEETTKEEVALVDEIVEPPKVGFDDNFTVDDYELQQYLAELESEQERKDAALADSSTKPHDGDAVQPEEKEVNNRISRPNTLEITSEKIDLVGDPGHTPYNNMYNMSNDTGSSRSVSPTFSDVSTDSVDSTPTTGSVTDSIDDKEVPKEEFPSGSQTENERNTENPLDGSEREQALLEITPDGVTDSVAGPATDLVPVVVNDNNVVESEEAIRRDGPSSWLGKQAPLWIPDSEALNCLHCDNKFTVIKRRHHCRACGLVLCSKCCNMKYRLEYLDAEARVCLKCYDILGKEGNDGSSVQPSPADSPNQPNPNNPMEYCSMIPPLQQITSADQNPPTVMVPVGVLKRKGSGKSRTNKSVMFCDGIRPGSELTNLDSDFNYNEARSTNSKKGSSPPPPLKSKNRNVPAMDANTNSFIPNKENCLPPTVTVFKSDISYTECSNGPGIVEMLKNEAFTFALQMNLHVNVKIINMDCCINKWAWCFSSEGMITVGQDEIVLLLELMEDEKHLPKDILLHINNIYNDAKKGSSITEYGISLHPTTNFLESKNHMGFLYVRPSFQCLQNVIVPNDPYLVGILIHRWEMPWAKIFPLRLILRLGAEYRYYPSPIISSRHRESVFVEIGHTIINLLADFRNFTYTLPNIRGLTIHMEDKNTTVTIPNNRYDQVMKSLSNSSDHILAFGGNFSLNADSHLVCIQDTHGNNENTYTTHAINIHNRPRKVTGASFIVFNGALKSSSGLTAKSSIVEDGLMIQIPPEQMVQIRESLRNMKSHTIQCGCVNATSDETVNIVWGENDVNFNVGVESSIDNKSLSGFPSIRVHNGKDYICNSGGRTIRWTEVFILQNGQEAPGEDVDFSKLAESIAKATCQALVKYLDLLASNNFNKIGIRATLHIENVSYSAGSNGIKLPPIYMKSLDNELIPVLHRITSNNLRESAIVLELVFRILNV